ncbi:exosome non-catalytic core subunit rrp46 [Exophiala xenobiotica]|uniref:Exosome non-catalytic core subunit rrp46 n=1 Tax=Lithohypha guttulata TaxID=1690604 RepID=A0ABR0KQ57_9EURO|nr:exosome non-catalytic core subunit rrp46 [Lithohypha guttulata]KAK5330751.1 exosome non-catalytic core subunit rrp46 [Exophiala xenobiotica]
MSQPTIELHTLSTSDGSATYTSPTRSHTILSGISYPLEVQYRSHELPEDTYIEVNIIPHNAVSQVKERHVEEIVRRVLKSVVRSQETPRCLLAVTLQVVDAEVDEEVPGGVKGGGQGEGYLEVLAGAINASVAGCLDGGVQMWGIAGAVVVGVDGEGEVVVWPGSRAQKAARSLHVFGFGRGGECLVVESEGAFEVEDWERAAGMARKVVLGRNKGDGDGDGDEDEDVDMDDDSGRQSLFGVMRQAVEMRVAKDGR